MFVVSLDYFMAKKDAEKVKFYLFSKIGINLNWGLIDLKLQDACFKMKEPFQLQVKITR